MSTLRDRPGAVLRYAALRPGSGQASTSSAATQDERVPGEPEQRGSDEEDSSDEKILAAARDDYKRARDAWSENQQEARADLEFARLGKQWDASVEQQRRRENRPCLTFNKM